MNWNDFENIKKNKEYHYLDAYIQKKEPIRNWVLIGLENWR